MTEQEQIKELARKLTLEFGRQKPRKNHWLIWIGAFLFALFIYHYATAQVKLTASVPLNPCNSCIQACADVCD